MRYRSIRELASGDTGLVVNDLKPIWLMSPLSVSDTLPLEPELFDVVIFDEASQIPTEEAVPALCRSRQVIIVGDEMQLPPTSFFSTALDRRGHAGAGRGRWRAYRHLARCRQPAQPGGAQPAGDLAGLALPQPVRIADQLLKRCILQRATGDHPRSVSSRERCVGKRQSI